jgi:hypothetical protein
MLAWGGGVHQLESETHRGWVPVAVGTTHAVPPLVERTDTTVAREVYGYMPYWATQNYLHFDLLTTLACFDVTLNPDGSITNGNGFPGTWAAAMDRAHRNGVRVEVVATCFGWSNIHQAITTGADSAIHHLVELASSSGVDGINMDFEDILGSDRDTMVIFIRRLSAACRAQGLTLTMATMPLDFSNAYDFAALADTTDGLFIMGYNYHWQGGPEAGPVAPLFGWPYYGNLQMTIQQYLAQTGDARKLIFGLPYYGFQWPTQADTTHSATAGYGEALYFVDAPGRAAQSGWRWDAESETPWYRFNNGGWNQGWFDDDTSLLLKCAEVHEHDFLGTGMWALGYDGARTELWAALREAFNRPLQSFVNGDCESWRLDTLPVPIDTSANPVGWYEGRKAKYRRETSVVRSGSSAIRHVPDSLGYAWPVDSRLFQDVQVLPGQRYELKGWAYKNDGRGNRMRLTVEWYDSLHRVITAASSPVLTHDSAAWVELTTGAVAAPAQVEFARLHLAVTGYGGFDLWDDLDFSVNTGGVAMPGASQTPPVLTPTFVRGVLYLPGTPGAGPEGCGRLLDAAGRMTAELVPGLNDVSRLAPGVYFVSRREESAIPKVVITR